MPRITLVRSAYGPNGTARDADSGVVIRAGQTLDVPADVAERLRSTEALGDVYEVEDDVRGPADPEDWRTAPATESDASEENDTPAPASADAPSAPEAQE